MLRSYFPGCRFTSVLVIIDFILHFYSIAMARDARTDADGMKKFVGYVVHKEPTQYISLPLLLLECSCEPFRLLAKGERCGGW